MDLFNYIRRAGKRRVRNFIWILSLGVFLLVFSLDRIQLSANLPFDPHIFAFLNACINAGVALTLLATYIAIRKKNRRSHFRLMVLAIVLSAFFLIFYILHHAFTGSTSFGGEGAFRVLYYVLLISHVCLAGVILPFILFTAYRGITNNHPNHRRLARFTFPLWLYVATSGVWVYLLISPYYA